MGLKEQLEVSDKRTIKEEVSISQRITKEAKETPKTPSYFPRFPGGPLVTNLWSSRSRLADFFKIEKEEIVDELAEAVNGPSEPVKIEEGEFEEVHNEDFDLQDLPIPKYYPKDGGRYITSGIVIAEQGERRNLSFHRMMLRDEKTFTLRLCPRDLEKMYDTAVEEGKDLEIAVVVGVNPAVLLAGATSVDYDTDELQIANSLLKNTKGGKIEVTELDNGITVPAGSEYVLQGRITSEKGSEGPFVDITGTYDKIREQPIVEIDKVMHKKEAIFHALLPGGYEHFLLMGLPRETSLKNELSEFSDVKDVRLTEGGCSWLHGVISIEKKNSDMEKIIQKAFQAHTSMKKVTVVDQDIDIFDDKEVEWAVATRFQPDEDLYTFEDEKGSSLDPSAPDLTAKWGLDATKPWEGEGFKRAEIE
ncbi:MAG: UbiD family decarboxylase [Candidatus Thermoplasmatota archaeon]|nr:UbiD family decarboxylase [Candidatus Thermoplasmatota archaeon]